MLKSSFRIAILQLKVLKDKIASIQNAFKLVENASRNKCDIVILPECFNSPYGNKYFPIYAEPIPGPTTMSLSEMAKSCGVYLIGGSIPELCDNKLYNTCTVYSPLGELLGKYRKMHLFDVDIPGILSFKESNTLSPGDSYFSFDTPFCRFGIGICYDLRFPELSMVYASKLGCQFLVFPAQFTMMTGSLHWELLTRSRSLDNQLYVASVSAARNGDADHVAWGHSTVCDPYGKVLGKAGFEEEILYTDIDIGKVEECRSQIPIRNQKRHDLYSLRREDTFI